MTTPRSRIRTRTSTSLALACWLAAGCSHYKPLPLREPANDDETGRVEVAVLSAVPFEALRAGFATNFVLKPADALTEALVTTQATQTTVNKATQLLISAAVPGASASAPGAIASAPSPKTPDALPAAGTPPATGAVSQHNAMLRYQLAASLLQEVAMLNSYVGDAPRRAGYDPFVVRLKVTVRPRARATPFDAQSDIRFIGDGREGVIVVPLLASDSEDATSASSLDRNLAQFGLAISALKGAYGLGGQFAHNAEDVVTSLGWQYQNVYNVARIDDQTVSLRVNAQPTGVNRFELTARSHYLTVLLLVRRPAPHAADNVACLALEDRPCVKVDFEASTQFVHATTGRAPGETSGMPGRPSPRVQPGQFHVFFWPDPKLPADGQLAPLLISGGKAPYKAQLKLRGGDNLTKSSVTRAALLVPSDTKEKTARPALKIEASMIDVPERGHDTLMLEFADLSAAGVERLRESQKLQVALMLGADARRGQRDHAAWTLTVTPDVTELQPEEPSFLSKFTPDKRLTVCRAGRGKLGIDLQFPKDKNQKDTQVQHVVLAFGGMVPAALALHAGAAQGCAVLGDGGVRVTGSCAFSVKLDNLPLPPQATPVTLSVSAVEYLTTAPSKSAGKQQASVSLQYPLPPGDKNCDDR